MFSRRRRSASLSRPTTPASASAQTAAAQAFLASQATNANISSAAAAAALRSGASTPTPVGDVQTRRMLQRQSSVSSTTRSPGVGRGQGLERRGSSGSMTERTFRTPSPSRPGSSAGPLEEETAPPVPPVPQKYGVPKQHKRAASVQPTPGRMMSPPPKVQGGRGASLDRKSDPAATPKRRPKSSIPALGNIAEQERPDSRNSINFSYPIHARPNSPPSQSASPVPTHAPAHRTTTNGTTPAEVSDVQRGVVDAANAPVKKKKKKVVGAAAEGSHLAAGHTGGKPAGSAIKKDEAEDIPEETVETTSTGGEKPISDSDSDTSDAGLRAQRAQRAAGILNKQPSVVREDWEGEQAAGMQEEDTSPSSSPIGQPQGRKEAYAPNTTRQLGESRTNSQPAPSLMTTIPSSEVGTERPSPKFLEPTEGIPNGQRTPSVSPSRSRSARFSANLASELTAGGRHDPPPRSVSPAKSALKNHSPGSQTRSPVDRAPAEWRLSSQPPSEASDNASTTSGDGSAVGRRKKSAHVSFGTETEVGGLSAPTTSETSAASPASKDRQAYHPSSTLPVDDDMDEVFRPRPVLPSFGSIRGKRDTSNGRPMTPLTETATAQSSTSSSLSNMAALETSHSSDNAIGSVFAREMNNNRATGIQPQDPNAPLPPEVTSVEGSGYVSDTDSTNSDIGQVESGNASKTDNIADPGVAADPTLDSSSTPLSPVIEEPEPKTTIVSSHFAATEGIPGEMVPREPVPQISIQPATPGPGDPDHWIASIPGGFPDFQPEMDSDSVKPSRGVTPEQAAPVPAEITVSSPAGLGIAEPEPVEAPLTQNPTPSAVGGLSEAVRAQPETQPQHGTDGESDDGSSVYSDAAEDIADLEGDGFGSINAIVESPVPPSPLHPVSTASESPTAAISGEDSVNGWTQAQAHWSDIAERQRQGSGPIGRIDPPPVVSETPKPQAHKKRLPPALASASVGQASVPAAERRRTRPDQTAPSGIQPQSGMRKSMRSQSQAAVEGPTMRGPGRTMGTKSSMRTSQPRPERATPVVNVQTKGALQKRNTPAIKPQTAVAPKPLTRTLSNGSDSSSSFKRQRKGMSTDGRYTMRRSLRATEERPQPPAVPAGRGVRSMSPPTNRRAFSPAGHGTMRTTMRGSVDSGTSALRNHQKTSSAFSGLGRSTGKSKPLITAPAPSPTVANRFRSRFANDSDDESPIGNRRYDSRFEDSSDDEPEPLRPVRGIPRNVDEGDSTDLEDSSDEGATRRSKAQGSSAQPLGKEKAVNLASVGRSGSGRDLSRSADIAASPSSQKKKGLFGRFRSKKVSDDSRIAKDLSESPARRDTHLERTRVELERARSPRPASTHGKLQRRHTPARVMSDSWPLPPKVGAEQDRPSTSDGIIIQSGVDGLRPDMPQRQLTSSTNQSGELSAVVGRTGKKKKFPMLRKAFGLSD